MYSPIMTIEHYQTIKVKVPKTLECIDLILLKIIIIDLKAPNLGKTSRLAKVDGILLRIYIFQQFNIVLISILTKNHINQGLKIR